ncbi:MAG: hypothetical protein HY717_16165 [Planctomycetes bacterium]|nr:hypothetical protein [Planctomycetota bacterium]
MIEFDRFTHRARKVLALARKEALRQGHDFIGSEHILLGLIRGKSCAAAQVLKNLGVQLDEARAAVKRLVKPGNHREDFGQLPFTPVAKRVLEMAAESARSLKHDFIGTEHLLLGILRLEDCVAVRVLEEMAIYWPSAEEMVLNRFGVEEADWIKPSASRDPAPLFSLVREEARRLRHHLLSPEHLLHAMLKRQGAAALVLRSFTVDLGQLEEELGRRLQPGLKEVLEPQIPLAPELRQVLEFAMEEAVSLGHDGVGDGHLLLGLLRLVKGPAGEVLRGLQLDLAEVRKRVDRLASSMSKKKSVLKAVATSVSRTDLNFTLALLYAILVALFIFWLLYYRFHE